MGKTYQSLSIKEFRIVWLPLYILHTAREVEAAALSPSKNLNNRLKADKNEAKIKSLALY